MKRAFVLGRQLTNTYVFVYVDMLVRLYMCLRVYLWFVYILLYGGRQLTNTYVFVYVDMLVRLYMCLRVHLYTYYSIDGNKYINA